MNEKTKKLHVFKTGDYNKIIMKVKKYFLKILSKMWKDLQMKKNSTSTALKYTKCQINVVFFCSLFSKHQSPDKAI